MLAAVLIETTVPDLLRLPFTIASFLVATPDTWIPLIVLGILMAGAFVLEISTPTRRQERLAWCLTGVVSVVGVAWFFRFGDLNWHATPDWIKEWTYYTALHESLSHGRLPWFLNATFQGTDRFFANPETNIAPQTLLLAWMDVPAFVILQCAAFVGLGVGASYYLARDLALTPVAAVAFLALFLMNGHVIAHLHTGHAQWVGYFAFPVVFLFLHRAAIGDMSGRTRAGLALGLALIELVGGWHLFVWCVIFIAVFVVSDRSRWRFGASLSLLVAGLSAVRILPAAVLYDSQNSEFVGSYQQLSILVHALVGELRRKVDSLDWWEYDVYVGWVGLIVIAAGLTSPLSRTWRHSVSSLWVPSVIMAVLSSLNIYKWTLFQMPGFESERVASRLLVVGLLGFALIGCVQLNLWLAGSRSRTRRAALAVAGLLMTTQLLVHTNGRRPTSDEGHGPPAFNVVSDRRPEMAYTATVGAGAALTLLSIVLAIRLWRRDSKTLVIGH